MQTDQLSIRSIILADDDDDLEFFSAAVKSLVPLPNIEYVSNGIRLMQLLEHVYPDLLFLDLEMPFKNGLEYLVEIRASEKLKELPVVVFSSTTRPANIQTAYDMGAHLFLLKSSNFDEYTNSIQAIVKLNWSDPQKIKEQYCVNGRYTVFQ
ncbi:MAG: response regulator [Chitinophagaceae bacterium]